jgi:hypothetical protein
VGGLCAANKLQVVATRAVQTDGKAGERGEMIGLGKMLAAFVFPPEGHLLYLPLR